VNNTLFRPRSRILARTGLSWSFAWLCVVILAAIGCSSPLGADGESTGEVSSALTATLTSITLSAVPVGVPRDVTFTIKATGMYSDGKARPLTSGVQWSSSNIQGAYVDNTGVVTVIAINVGLTTITVRDTATNKSASVSFAITLATVASLNITPAMKTVAAGTVQPYNATAVFSDASKYPLIAGALTWSSSNPAVAPVNVTGGATALTPGVSVIAVRHIRSGMTDATTLTVGNVTLTSLAVSPGTSDIPNTTILPFAALATYSDGSVVNVTTLAKWKSSNAAVATISSGGVATAVGNGFTTITTAFATLSGTVGLTVGPITLKSIAITPPTPSVPLGAPSSLVATGTFIDKTTRDVTGQVTWTSTNISVVTVSNALGERGKLTTVGVGTARIRATDPTTGVTTSVPIVVTAAQLASLTITPPQVIVPAGLTVACRASGLYTDGTMHDFTTAVTWTIVGAAGVSISNAPGSEGLLSAATVGPPRYVQATDPATMITAQAAVTVTPALQTGLEITPPVASISAGATQAFVATAIFSDGTRMDRPSVAWTSSNPAAVSVANGPPPTGGVATGVAAGSSVVSTSDNGFAASANVTVTPPTFTSMTVSSAFPSNGSTPVGRVLLFRAIVRLSDGTAFNASNDVTWSTSDPAIASISNAAGSKGLVTGISVGSFVITAVHPASGFVATLNWNISAAVLLAAEIVPLTVSVPAGRTVPVTALGHYSDGTDHDVTQLGAWTIGDPSIASVTTGGAGPELIRGIAVGTTTVVLQPFRATGNVEVTPAVLEALTLTGSGALTVGAVSPFTAEGVFSDATHIAMTTQVLWSSSNTAIASVSNAAGHEGEVTAIGAGVATITATDGASGLSALGTVAVSPAIPVLSAGFGAACVLSPAGRVRCWGRTGAALGIGQSGSRGGDPRDMGANLPELDLGTGRRARALASGSGHVCAVLDDGSVKCWGNNDNAQLGQGDLRSRGGASGQMGDALPGIELGSGARATAVAAGLGHSCALLVGGNIKCWGLNSFGQLGLGDAVARGGVAGTMGDALPAVSLGPGRTAKAIGAGSLHTCAILDDGTVKCWGGNALGQLGLGDTLGRGTAATDMGSALPTVALGTGRTARAIALSDNGACALLDNGTVKCWGALWGNGDNITRGQTPGQMGDALPSVDLGQGRSATSITAGSQHVCAILDDGQLKCWGSNNYGGLGLGDTRDRGSRPGEMGDALPAVELGTGRAAKGISAAFLFSCAVLDDSSIKCWGFNDDGELGLGDTRHRGLAPGQMGDSLPAVDLTPPIDVQSDVANCGVRGHSCLGGACANGVCQPFVIVANQQRPGLLRLVGSTLTWVAHGDGFNAGGGVYRSNVDGTGLHTIASGLQDVGGLDVDATSIVWSAFGGVNIVPVGGGAPLLIDQAFDGMQIAMDATTVYMTTFQGNQVRAVARSGWPPSVVSTFEDAPVGIALDDTNVYFTNIFTGDVKSVPKAGGPPMLLATGRGASLVAIRAGYAFWPGEAGIKRVPVAGGATEVLDADPAIQESAIAVDDDSVFFTTFDPPTGFGTIQSVPLGGGAAHVLASGTSFITEGLQSDGAALYYTDMYGGRVLKVAK
jgi:alpha-tubulin suppressor-like RCC1 family protein